MLGLFLQNQATRFVLPIEHVVEVIPAVALHPANNGSADLAGVFRYRGEITPVLSLMAEQPTRLSSRIVILQATLPGETIARQLGLLTESIADLKPIQTTGHEFALTPEDNTWAEAVVADQDGLLRLIDPLKLLRRIYHPESSR
ncbi:MAG: chemotaxis protein CheW [Fimbriiglobus sp.]